MRIHNLYSFQFIVRNHNKQLTGAKSKRADDFSYLWLSSFLSNANLTALLNRCDIKCYMLLPEQHWRKSLEAGTSRTRYLVPQRYVALLHVKSSETFYIRWEASWGKLQAACEWLMIVLFGYFWAPGRFELQRLQEISDLTGCSFAPHCCRGRTETDQTQWGKRRQSPASQISCPLVPLLEGVRLFLFHFSKGMALHHPCTTSGYQCWSKNGLTQQAAPHLLIASPVCETLNQLESEWGINEGQRCSLF